jgi:TolA-binding protein
MRLHILFCFTILFSFSFFQALHAQLGFELDIKKPEPYENRELKAEKTGDKKLKQPRRTFQNLTTHYNYFFNSRNKLAEIIDRAKLSHKEDYSLLLPFYNYSLQTTTQDSSELDSVIYKTKTGIVLHDLRNDWIDDLYLLWGAAYYFQQQYDSAYQMFQFINYAFAEKEKDGYYRYIGSRMDGNNALSIATKENEKLLKRILSDPPSRNMAFIWQIRTMIEQDALPEAGSLIATLKTDPDFPSRLHNSLEEVQAYWFYKQQLWDSAALHLVKALDEAGNKQERSRWEYLAAQLFERSGSIEEARKYYVKSIAHATDPVLEVYARLNMIRINKEGGDDYIDRNIAELIKMARRDKFEEYRDVIYSMAAQMEIERGNFKAAQDYLIKSSKYKTDNTTASNRAYFQLAQLAYARKDYKQASAFYDSLLMNDLPDAELEGIMQRREMLTRLISNINAIEKEDSLQRIASMPDAERTAYIKKMVRQLRKQQGLKDEGVLTAGRAGTTTLPDPFTAQQKNKGEWYFYNNNLKANGITTFKQTWGNRPNVDNWRRFTDVTAQLKNKLPNSGRDGQVINTDVALPPTYDVLLANLPTTPDALVASNDSIKKALGILGSMYVNELEDYTSAIEVYEQLRSRYPSQQLLPEALFNLYFSYAKTGNTTRASEIKQLLSSRYPNDRYTIIATTGKDPFSTRPTEAITSTYEAVYDLFIEGKYAEAKTAKSQADSMYKTNYWSPQLLYIEAVYHIRQREDSIAKTVLNTLIQQNEGTLLGEKAKNMIQVLNRRQQIEEELTNLQIVRPVEDSLFVEPMPVAAAVQKRDTVISKPQDAVVNLPSAKKQISDTIFKNTAPVKSNSVFSFRGDRPHAAVVVLNKVDVVFVNEAKNAFNRYTKEKYYNLPIELKIVPVNDDIKLLHIGYFTNAQAAIDYIQKTKPIAASQIVPWLKSDKFSFSIISEENLQAVISTKDFAAYQTFLDQNLPVKF